MISRFKSAINQIKAEEDLISRTEGFLKDALINENTKNIKYNHWRPFPSVEIGVSAFDKVVKVKGINDDGNKILAKISIKGSNVTVAVSTLVYSAVDNGFIADNGSSVVSLTSETDNSKTAAKLENDAETGANQALQETDTTATVIKDNVALARRDQARALGISPGKLNLINKLQKVDPTATVDEYKDTSVKDIMKTIKDSKDKLKNNADKKDENKEQNKDQNKDQTNSTADNNTNTRTTTTGTAADSSNANKSNAAKTNNASKANEKEDKISDEDKGSKDNHAASVTNKSNQAEDEDTDNNEVDNKNQGATKSNAAAHGNKNNDVNKNSDAR